MPEPHPPFVALAAVEPVPRAAEHRADDPATAQRFDCARAALGDTLGLTRLGVNVTVVKPGKAAYPFHSHRANDELFLILAGRGVLRWGTERHEVTVGDLIGCPAGDAGTAHQLVNTGSGELRYLAVSTKIEPEICEYPDSGKIGAYHGRGAEGFVHFSRQRDALDYWEGE